MLLEDQARLLLVLHAVLGAATVATTTHLAIWAYKLVVRRDPGRTSGVTWFAGVGLAIYVAQFALGNLIYPVYKVRVRAEYLDAPAAIAADSEARRAARREVEGPLATDPPPPRLAHVARMFDIKEHLAALGLPLVAATFALRRRRGPAADRLLLACACGAALFAWLAALIGIVTTSYRSIGSL